MKTKPLLVLAVGCIALAGISQAGAEEKLVSGKDRIDVPAIGDGLCLHNLFQTGMVLQRDKPVRIADMYEIYTGKKSATPNILGGVEHRDLRNALKAEDVKRRRNEAETFIKEHPDTGKAPQK